MLPNLLGFFASASETTVFGFLAPLLNVFERDAERVAGALDEFFFGDAIGSNECLSP